MKHIKDKTRLMSNGRGDWNVRNRRRLLVLAENLADFRRSREDLRNGRIVKCTLEELFATPEEDEEIQKPYRKPPSWANKDYRKGREKYWVPFTRYWERKEE